MIIIMTFINFGYNYSTGPAGVADITVTRVGIPSFTGSFSLNVGGCNSVLLSADADGNDIERALKLLPSVNMVSVIKSETATNSDIYNPGLRSESQRTTVMYEITFMHDHNWYPMNSVYPYTVSNNYTVRDQTGVKNLTEFRPAFGPMSSISVDTSYLTGDGVSTDVSVIKAGYTTPDTLNIIISDLSFDPATSRSDSLSLSSLQLYVLPTPDPHSVNQ